MNLDVAIGLRASAGGTFDRGLRELAAELTRHPLPAVGTEPPCPADRRIEAFLQARFADLTGSDPLRLPPPSCYHGTGCA